MPGDATSAAQYTVEFLDAREFFYTILVVHDT